MRRTQTAAALALALAAAACDTPTRPTDFREALVDRRVAAVEMREIERVVQLTDAQVAAELAR